MLNVWRHIVTLCYGCTQGITYKGRCSVCGAPIKER